LEEPSKQVRPLAYQHASSSWRPAKRKAIIVAVLLIAGWLSKTVYYACFYEPPIRFYGRVVDQSGQPVAGADVTLEIDRHHGGPLRLPALFGPPEGTTITRHIVTDSAGAFTVRDRGYELIIVDVKKDLYGRLLQGHGYAFEDGWVGSPRFFPNAQSPEIFILQSLPTSK
jgi:hypothetical protein